MTLQGKCYTSETMQTEDFTPASMIKGHRIIFRPDKELKDNVTNGLSLKRISSEALA